jgi:hypothetical protein
MLAGVGTAGQEPLMTGAISQQEFDALKTKALA